MSEPTLAEAIASALPGTAGAAVAAAIPGYLAGRLDTRAAQDLLAELDAGAEPAAGVYTFREGPLSGEIVVRPGADGGPAPQISQTIVAHQGVVRDVLQLVAQRVEIRLGVPPAPAVPSAPAPRAAELYGRQALRDTLVGHLLAAGPRAVVGVHGSPGMGKTDLVRAIAWDTRVRAAHPGGVLYAELSETRTVSDVLAGWLRQLDVTATEEGGVAASISLLRDRAGRAPTLFVLDDVWQGDRPTLEQLLEAVPAGGRVLLCGRDVELVSAYRRGGPVVPVGPISAEAGLEFLSAYAPDPVAAEPEPARTLVGELGAMPGALVFAGRLISVDRVSPRPVGHLLDTWRVRLGELSRGGPAAPELMALHTLIDISYQRLPRDARTPAGAVAVFGPTPLTFDFAALRAVWGRYDPAQRGPRAAYGRLRRTFGENVAHDARPAAEDTARRWEHALVTSGLLEYDPHTRAYRTHQVVHAFLESRTDKAAVVGHAGHYVNLLRDCDAALTSPDSAAARAAMATLDAAFPQVERVWSTVLAKQLVSPVWFQVIVNLPVHAHAYLAWRNRQEDLYQMTRAALDRVSTMRLLRAQRGPLLLNIINPCGVTDRIDEGQEAADECLATGVIDAADHAYATAILRRKRGDHEGALVAYRARVDELEAQGKTADLITVLNNLGNTYKSLERMDEARDAYQAAVRTAQRLVVDEMSPGSVRAAMEACRLHVALCEHTGRHDDQPPTRAFAERLVDRFGEAPGQAAILVDSSAREGRTRDEAVAVLRRALRLAERFHERQAVVGAHGALAFHLLDPDPATALEHAREAIRITNEQPGEFQVDGIGQARLLGFAGGALARLGNHGYDCLDALRSAAKLSERAGEWAFAADYRLDLAHAHLVNGSYGKAEEALTAGRAAARRMDPEPGAVMKARLRLKLSEVCRETGRAARAAKHFRKAEEVFTVGHPLRAFLAIEGSLLFRRLADLPRAAQCIDELEGFTDRIPAYLVWVHAMRSQLDVEAGDYLRMLDRATAIAHELATADLHADVRTALGWHPRALHARSLWLRGHQEEAAAAAREALPLMDHHVAENEAKLWLDPRFAARAGIRPVPLGLLSDRAYYRGIAGRRDDALADLRQVRRESERRGWWTIAGFTVLTLAELHAGWGDPAYAATLGEARDFAADHDLPDLAAACDRVRRWAGRD